MVHLEYVYITVETNVANYIQNVIDVSIFVFCLKGG